MGSAPSRYATLQDRINFDPDYIRTPSYSYPYALPEYCKRLNFHNLALNNADWRNSVPPALMRNVDAAEQSFIDRVFELEKQTARTIRAEKTQRERAQLKDAARPKLEAQSQVQIQMQGPLHSIANANGVRLRSQSIDRKTDEKRFASGESENESPRKGASRDIADLLLVPPGNERHAAFCYFERIASGQLRLGRPRVPLRPAIRSSAEMLAQLKAAALASRAISQSAQPLPPKFSRKLKPHGPRTSLDASINETLTLTISVDKKQLTARGEDHLKVKRVANSGPASLAGQLNAKRSN